MIGKLTGRIDYIDSDHLILDVNSIGYTIYSPARFLSQSSIDDKISLFIYSQTREDGVYLYGFENIILKKQFLLLVTVKGVGPKLALSIISEMTIDEIGNAILMQDKNGFKRVSGLGPKIAERIIVELKNKTKELSLGDGVVTSIISDNKIVSDIKNDAISALTNLGIGKSEAFIAISKILKEDPGLEIDKLITKALQNV